MLSAAQSQTLVGMLTLAGVAGESMVQDVGWTMMDIGKRIERGLGLTALLAATVTTVRAAVAERAIIESTLVACESSVIYRRRTVGQVSVAALAELMLFDATNPRSRADSRGRREPWLRLRFPGEALENLAGNDGVEASWAHSD